MLGSPGTRLVSACQNLRTETTNRPNAISANPPPTPSARIVSARRYSNGQTNEGRVFVVAQAKGEKIAEVALEGHEPKPCHQVYPALSRSETHLCTDLHAFAAVGNNLVLSVHTNGKTTNRKDTLLIWRTPS